MTNVFIRFHNFKSFTTQWQKQDIADLRDQMGQLMQMVSDLQQTMKSAKK